jgi:hypothetical protein
VTWVVRSAVEVPHISSPTASFRVPNTSLCSSVKVLDFN